MTLQINYTNPQGNQFPEAVLKVQEIRRNKTVSEYIQLNEDYTAYVSNTSGSSDTVNYSCSIWSDGTMLAASNLPYVYALNGMTNFNFQLTGERLDVYNASPGTEEDKLIATCEYDLQERMKV